MVPPNVMPGIEDATTDESKAHLDFDERVVAVPVKEFPILPVAIAESLILNLGCVHYTIRKGSKWGVVPLSQKALLENPRQNLKS